MLVSTMSATEANVMVHRDMSRSFIPRQHMTMGASSSQSSAVLSNYKISEIFNAVNEERIQERIDSAVRALMREELKSSSTHKRKPISTSTVNPPNNLRISRL